MKLKLEYLLIFLLLIFLLFLVYNRCNIRSGNSIRSGKYDSFSVGGIEKGYGCEFFDEDDICAQIHANE